MIRSQIYNYFKIKENIIPIFMIIINKSYLPRSLNDLDYQWGIDILEIPIDIFRRIESDLDRSK